MKLGINAKLEEKLTCAFQNDMRNLAYFYQSTLKTSKSRLDEILSSKVKNRMTLKFTRSHVS